MIDKNQYKANEEEMGIDLREILKVLKKRLNLIIVMTILCGFVAGLVNYFVLTPIYQAQTMLKVTQATETVQANTTTSSDGDNLDNLDNVSRLPVQTMKTYLNQLKSEDLINRIIKKLDLNCSSGSVAGMINAQVLEGTNLIQIDVTNKDPVLASKIANTLSDEYLKYMTEKYEEQMSRSVVLLEKQKKINDKELNIAEEKLKQLLSQTRSVAVMQAESTQISEDAVTANSNFQSTKAEIEQLSSSVNAINQELADTPQYISLEKSDLQSTKAEIQQLNSSVNAIKEELADTPQYISVEQVEQAEQEEQSDSSTSTSTSKSSKTQQLNPIYIALSQQLAETKAALAAKQGQYAAQNTQVKLNPVYVTLSQRLAETKTTLAAKQGQYSAQNAQVRQLNAQLTQQDDPALKQLEQDKLQSDVDRLRKTSETLAQKGTEAQISKSIILGDTSVQVASAASIPTSPVKPNKHRNIGIALLLGMAISTLLAFLLDYLDNTLKTPEDITRELKLPVLG
ncbi:MAG: Wzz/FepE/Etk N-terminal domain-containing protein, partial [Syntrophomonas sp.]